MPVIHDSGIDRLSLAVIPAKAESSDFDAFAKAPIYVAAETECCALAQAQTSMEAWTFVRKNPSFPGMAMMKPRGFLDAGKPARSPDPEGGGHGCPPFSDRAMEGEYENAEGVSGRWTVLFGEAISFW